MADLQLVGNKKLSLVDQAELIIKFLNDKTGKNYPTKNPKGRSTANIDIVVCRLKEGWEIADFKAVIARKAREWKDNDKMSYCLRPKTLFNRTNFETYIGECSE